MKLLFLGKVAPKYLRLFTSSSSTPFKEIFFAIAIDHDFAFISTGLHSIYTQTVSLLVQHFTPMLNILMFMHDYGNFFFI